MVSFLLFSQVAFSLFSCVSCLVESNSLQPLDCSSPSSSVHGVLKVRILEGDAITLSRGFCQLRD